MSPHTRADTSLGRFGRVGPFLFPLLLIATTLVVGVFAVIEAVQWRGQPFPGFFAYSSGLISPMQRSEWEGRRQGLLPGDQVLTLDGVPFSDRAALRRCLNAHALGDVLKVEALRKGQRLQASVTLKYFSDADVLITLATPFSIGIIYLIVGGVLFFLKPRAKPALLVLLLLDLISIFYLTTFDANTSWLLERIWIGYPFFGAAAIHLFTVFPEELAFARRHPWVRAIPYGIAGLLVLFRHLYLDEVEASTALAYAATAYVTLVTIVDFALLGMAWRQTTSELTVRKVKVILVGLLFTSTLAVVWSFAARLDPEATTWEMAMLLSAPFPILMTYSVLKQNIFDVDAMLRQTATYFLSTVLVLALYFSVVAFFTLVTQQYLPFYETTVTAVLATLAVAVVFHPLRVRVQRMMSRLFFREKYDFGTAIAELNEQLSKVTDVESLARGFTARLALLLRVDQLSLFALDKTAGALTFAGGVGSAGDGAPKVRFAVEGALAEVLRHTPRPWRVSTLIEMGGMPEDDAARFEALRARLVVPLCARDALVGTLVIGGARFEQVFRDQDLRLLETVETPLAIAIENALLYTERAEKERLAALGQVATFIIHEVKNPLAIIRASMGTIKRRLNDDRSRELAAMVEEEVERMNRTTAKILSFARSREPEARACDLGQVVRRALAFVEPELVAAGISLVADLEPAAPHVHADAEQIEAMVLNLVLNAKEAVPRGGHITVRTRRSRDWQGPFGRGQPAFELVVEDDGAGMDDATRAKLFTPFFTTRRGGTGLGLAIVQHIVQAHRGEIRVESELGQGSRFLVQLPAEERVVDASPPRGEAERTEGA